MQGKIRILLMISFMMVMIMNVDVFAITGKGTQANPFVVSAEKGLREALTEYTNITSWIYIAVNGNIEITDTIQVDYGKYRIYAVGADRTIKRSTKYDSKVNLKNNKYCVKIMEGVQINFGYNASSYKLIFNGSKSYFDENNRCSGLIRIGPGGTCTIGVNGQIKNAMNNNSEQNAAPITSWGNLTVNGEILNCQGMNGGAIKSLNGTLTINDGASIHNCYSETEGGAIHISGECSAVMNGGQIYACTAAEEGGAFFAKNGSECKILAGTIKNNKAGATAGGVFAGLSSILIIGTPLGSGPEIAYNTAGGSGGGIRCNGGVGLMAGGTTYINGGNIHHNTSGRFGGGIACGEPGAEQKSELVIRNTNISNNTSVSDGGGIWTPNGGGGMFSDLVIIMNSKIENNVSERAGGGIMVQCNVEMSDCRVAGNSAKGNAGGIHINTGGEFTLQSGYIGSNKCDVQGSGIYVKGRFNILSDAVVETNNIVYLTEGTYIDIIGKLNKSSGYIANIDSEVKTNGTKLVKADYTGTSATKELYYSKTADDEYKNSKVLKKYTYNNLPASRCLRPTEKVNGYDGIYIILSEKYTISYDKNTTENIDNMPDSQVKFWEENIKISNNIISRNGSSPNSAKHWNINKDGSGTQVKPGSEYKINGNKTLYAQWILWQMILKDRYYMVGQKITLDKSELLKKTVIENGDSLSKYQFKIKQIKNSAGSVIVSGADVVTDTYMNTIKPVQYTLKVEVSDSDLNTVTGEMTVYVLDVPIIKGSVRFISLGYISTLQSDSRWNLSLNERLVESLSKKQGQGCYKISISNEEIKDIKSKIRENNYKITNGMNKSLAGRLQRVVPSEN